MAGVGDQSSVRYGDTRPWRESVMVNVMSSVLNSEQVIRFSEDTWNLNICYHTIE